MLKSVIGVLTFLFVAGSSLAYSQESSPLPREKAHPLFLIEIESLIEGRPRIGELFELGGSLSQGIGASTHEFNRINLALLTDLSCHRHHPVCTLPCLS